MPRVTQYIRDEDFEAWKAIPNKSEFIHNALNGWGGGKSMVTEPYRPPQLNPDFREPEVIKTKQDAVKVVKEVFPDAKPIPPVTYKKTSNWGA